MIIIESEALYRGLVVLVAIALAFLALTIYCYVYSVREASRRKQLKRDADLIRAQNWVEIEDRHNVYHFENGVFFLYLPDNDKNQWIFDWSKKKGPGVIARFDSPLLSEDIGYMNCLIDKEKQVARINEKHRAR